MRSALDLLELPYSFTQADLLTADGFVREARDRDVTLTLNALESLHRLRLFVPLLRVSRDRRAIVRATSGAPALAHQLAHWQHTQPLALREAHARRRLHDPAAERFMGRQQLRRTAGREDYLASEYIYSPHQLVLLPTIEPLLPRLIYDADRRVTALDIDPVWQRGERERAVKDRSMVVMVSALEPVYYPQIIRRLRFPGRDDFARYEGWRRKLPLGRMLKWLGLTGQSLSEVARGLLWRADCIDPLGDWLTLVREADPEHWKRLKGPARIAIDLRISAEVLLRYHDVLVSAKRARPLPRGKYIRGEFDSRLKPQGHLDDLLTRFGLSPHPQLVLVVEGETELLLFPRVMELVGVRTDDEYITIQNAEGVAKSITSLVAYAIAPRGRIEDGGRYIEPSRPLTRLLAVTDAEGPVATSQQRAKRRRNWEERILRTLAPAQRTPRVKEAIHRLVHVDVWNRRGASFEFAHFTDQQLARAITRLDKRPNRPTLATRVDAIAAVRARRGNLDSVLHGASKPQLAEELWPVLEAKIRRAEDRGTERRIPIIRILDRATDLAREMPRGRVVIPISNE